MTNLTSSGAVNPTWTGLYVTLGIFRSGSLLGGRSVNVKLSISEAVLHAPET